MTLTRITAPATDLITLAQAKAHLRVDHDAENDYISALVSAATAYLDARDGVLGEALVTQTWRYSMDVAPVGAVELPLGPVQSVVSVGYYDTAGAQQTFSAANYRLTLGGAVELVSGASWPSLASRSDAIWIDYVAGYGTATDVPQTVLQACRLMVGEMFENRASASTVQVYGALAMKLLLGASRSARGLF
ncbi:MAG: hypothetical protein EBR82_31505 [Caulobacteraceae bacterium]|nr:hypothetical protein [Caulobacteraceae bacterium]